MVRTEGLQSTGLAYIALGTNLPHGGLSGADLLRAAAQALCCAGLKARRASSIWRTAPWPPAAQHDFHNAVLEVDPGERGPEAVFEITSGIEQVFGRERRQRWDARTLDLDLIDHDGRVGTFGALVLPHPRAHERAFVLAPLAELDWVHPVTGRSAAELLDALPTGQDVVKTDNWLLPTPTP